MLNMALKLTVLNFAGGSKGYLYSGEVEVLLDVVGEYRLHFRQQILAGQAPGENQSIK